MYPGSTELPERGERPETEREGAEGVGEVADGGCECAEGKNGAEGAGEEDNKGEEDAEAGEEMGMGEDAMRPGALMAERWSMKELCEP